MWTEKDQRAVYLSLDALKKNHPACYDASSFLHDINSVGAWMREPGLTLRPEDLAHRAARLIESDPLVHIPVENQGGQWLGMVSHRDLIRQLGRGVFHKDLREMTVEELMVDDWIFVSPGTGLLEAVQLMREHHLSCLPVLEKGILLGVLTEREVLIAVDQLCVEPLSRAA